VLLPFQNGNFNLALKSQAPLQADLHTSELFIKLLCQFEPDAVLKFLQSHQTYRVQVSIPLISVGRL